MDLAPTSSTTVSLVAGDALAIALLEARGFTAEDFAFSHPAGALGRKLLLKVDDIMHGGDELPRVSAGTLLDEALVEVSSKGLGLTTVLDADGKLLGVFTDGDLRRALDNNVDIHSSTIESVMSVDPITIDKEILAAEALHIMEERTITGLITVDENHRPTGVVKLQDILKAGVV
jgi:arabinose-5-phosphate isomerase